MQVNYSEEYVAHRELWGFAVSISKRRIHQKTSLGRKCKIPSIFHSAHWKREWLFKEVWSSELAINKALHCSVSTDVCLPALGLSLRLSSCSAITPNRKSTFDGPMLCASRQGGGMLV